MEKEKLICVVGTNASGKSALGIALAQRFGGEILSADSRQIFEGFDLCCGKVTAEERALVPHHLLDVRKIGEPFSVSDYQSECYRLIPEIVGRGHVPMLVGGTGLYVSAVVKGYALMQGEPDEALRKELEGKELEELYPLLPPQELQRLKGNPSDYRNKRRIIRCIEKSRSGEQAAAENAAPLRRVAAGPHLAHGDLAAAHRRTAGRAVEAGHGGRGAGLPFRRGRWALPHGSGAGVPLHLPLFAGGI